MDRAEKKEPLQPDRKEGDCPERQTPEDLPAARPPVRPRRRGYFERYPQGPSGRPKG